MAIELSQEARDLVARLAAATDANRPHPERRTPVSTTPQSQIQCARSATGRHELATHAQVTWREDRQDAGGVEIWVYCRHCKASGRAVLEDAQVQWDDAEQVPS